MGVLEAIVEGGTFKNDVMQIKRRGVRDFVMKVWKIQKALERDRRGGRVGIKSLNLGEVTVVAIQTEPQIGWKVTESATFMLTLKP